ncbi:MAG TPA: DHHA1 domain-containing protein, partial [Kofleriaceae bacterium]
AVVEHRQGKPAIVIAGDGWPAGVVGIVAAKLVDRYQRPAFVIGVDPATGIGRGSARTCGGVDLYRALCAAADDSGCMGRFGGHAAAAGFTVTRDSIPAVCEAITHACAKLASGSGPTPIGREIDAEVPLAEVDERLAQELAGLGPFGQHNPSPVLVTRNARVTAARRVGDGSHLKLTLEDERTSATRSAIGFKLGDRPIDVGHHVDLAFLPTISIFQGRRSAEMELLDVAVSEPAPRDTMS